MNTTTASLNHLIAEILRAAADIFDPPPDPIAFARARYLDTYIRRTCTYSESLIHDQEEENS